MIRQAAAKDYKQVFTLENKLIVHPDQLQDQTYRIELQKNGFLLPSDQSQAKYLEDLTRIMLVSEDDKQINGFIRIDDNEPLIENRQAFIFREDLHTAFLSENIKFLGRIAVAPEKRKQGIASKLYQEAEKQLRSAGIGYIFSFVVISPLLNASSILFHESNGFERVDISEPFTFAGFSNYQSFLYGKKLS